MIQYSRSATIVEWTVQSLHKKKGKGCFSANSCFLWLGHPVSSRQMPNLEYFATCHITLQYSKRKSTFILNATANASTYLLELLFISISENACSCFLASDQICIWVTCTQGNTHYIIYFSRLPVVEIFFDKDTNCY